MSPGLQLPQRYPLPLSVLVVGFRPHQDALFNPLSPPSFHLTYVAGVPGALAALATRSFQLVCSSTNLKPIKLLHLLEAVKHASAEHLIPVILVIDLTQRVAVFPTSTWAGRFGLVHSQTSPAEWQALLDRLLS